MLHSWSLAISGINHPWLYQTQNSQVLHCALHWWGHWAGGFHMVLPAHWGFSWWHFGLCYSQAVWKWISSPCVGGHQHDSLPGWWATTSYSAKHFCYWYCNKGLPKWQVFYFVWPGIHCMLSISFKFFRP